MLKLWIEENTIEKPDYPREIEFYRFQEKIEITHEIKKDISKRVLFSLEKPGYLKFKFCSLNSEELEIGTILQLERDLTDSLNLYKIDLKYENNVIGSLPIVYSKAIAIEMDLNNVKLFAEVVDIEEDNVVIITENEI